MNCDLPKWVLGPIPRLGVRLKIIRHLLIGLWIFSIAPSAFSADKGALLVGRWKYIGYVYDEVFHAPPNPNLILSFEFLSDGTDVLRWFRLNEHGFCERKGLYTFDGSSLTDEVTWVNPENAFECYRDPDMVVGKKKVTPMRRVLDRLYMELPLSDETLIYVWEKERTTIDYQRTH
ncbi:MAG: hypothetical protein RJB66_1112 [Pseudomonadota bacterium]|jgi:hypothetical protein